MDDKEDKVIDMSVIYALIGFVVLIGGLVLLSNIFRTPYDSDEKLMKGLKQQIDFLGWKMELNEGVNNVGMKKRGETNIIFVISPKDIKHKQPLYIKGNNFSDANILVLSKECSDCNLRMSLNKTKKDIVYGKKGNYDTDVMMDFVDVEDVLKYAAESKKEKSLWKITHKLFPYPIPTATPIK